MITCTINGCDNKHEGLGYCKSHYKSFLRHGDPLEVDRRRKKREAKKKAAPKRTRINRSTKGTCSVEGCESPIKAKGLCSAHHARMLRNNTLELQNNVFEFETCTLMDCDDPHFRRGYCSYHYHVFKETGSPYRAKVIRLCGVIGCTKTHLAKGLCTTHYRQWRSIVDEHQLEERMNFATEEDAE